MMTSCPVAAQCSLFFLVRIMLVSSLNVVDPASVVEDVKECGSTSLKGSVL